MTLKSVTELRAAAFDLLEETAHRGPEVGGCVSEAVDRLQVVANELGAIEELLGEDQPLAGDLRRRRYAARAYPRQLSRLQLS